MEDYITPSHNKSKRIAKNTMMLYVRTLLIMLVSLYTSRVVLGVLGVEDFGIYDVVGGVVTIFSFLNWAMAAATQRYLNFELGKGSFERLKTVFSTSIIIHAGISFIILVISETVGLWFLQNKMVIPGDRVVAAFWVYQISILSSLITFISVPYHAAIMAHEKMSAYAYISIIDVTGRLLAVYLLLWVSSDKLIFYAIFVCIVQIMVRLIYRGYCRKYFQETHYSFIWDKQLFYNMLSFCGWNLFGNIAHVCLTQGTNVLLNMFFSPVVNAAKGISAQVQLAISNFCQNLQLAINPQIVKSYAANDIQYTNKLIFLSSRLNFYLVLLLSLPILLETNQILHLWLKNVPEYTVIFVQLSMVISWFQALSNPLITGNAATGKVKTLMATVGSLFCLVVPLSYIGLKLGGAPPTVFTVQIGLVLAAHIIRIRIVSKQLGFSFSDYYRETLRQVLVVLILCVIPPYLVTYFIDESLARLFLTGITTVLSIGATAFFLGITHEERNIAKRIITEKIIRR
ncbi:hypothetical protein FACS1894181_07790 [Bacteroidia bacterium]|nr:hypothetical protein FACS1894181_07790 [Bacteroidia bacterium]